MFSISQSKLKTWRRCRNLYFYKYVEKIEPKRIQRPLVFGRMVHEMIEFNALKKKPELVIKKYEKEIKKVFSSEREAYREIITDVTLIMDEYFEYYKKDKLKPLLVEKAFEVTLCKGINIKGKIDEVDRDLQGRNWLVEHKSHKHIPDEDKRFRDLQTVIYSEVLPDLGIKKVDGVMWDYIRTKPPTVPQLLKNGTLSNKRIDTLPSVFLKAIEDNGLKAKDYKKKLSELEGAADTYFKRIYMPINKKMVKQLWDETEVTAREILEKGGKDRTRNPTNDCSWCSYKSLCRAELIGHDAHFIRKNEFTQRKEEERGNEEPQ